MFAKKYKSYLYTKYGVRSEFVESLLEKNNILGKRKLVEAFGEEIYKEKDRYGQDIPADFFKTNIGHGVKLN